MLSKQGQAEVVREGSYLPLTAAAAAEQMKKLDSGVTPPELRVIHKASAIKVRMSIDEDPIVVRLAESLGYFEQEGIELERVDVEKITGEDYLMQEPLAKGQIDAAYCWFNHAIYGARHGFPVQAVMLFNDAPGMKVLVADRMKGRIASAADFTGRKVAAGAGYIQFDFPLYPYLVDPAWVARFREQGHDPVALLDAAATEVRYRRTDGEFERDERAGLASHAD